MRAETREGLRANYSLLLPTLSKTGMNPEILANLSNKKFHGSVAVLCIQTLEARSYINGRSAGFRMALQIVFLR
jgi:hypothetical protein